MSTTDQVTDLVVDDFEPEPRLALDLGMREADALRTWLLKPAVDGTTSFEDALVNEVLTKLSRALDSVQATLNVRRELETVGLNVAHLSDEQVRELGRRVSEVSQPGIRS